MSDSNSWNNIRDEIRGVIDDAIRTGDLDFTRLGNNISASVSEAMKTVSAKMEQSVNEGNRAQQNYTQRMAEQTRMRKEIQQEIVNKQRQARLDAIRARAPFRPLGKVSSILYKVFGGIGTTVFGILSCVFFGLSFAESGFGIAFFFMFIFLLLSIAMIDVGVMQKKRLDKATKYYQLAGNNHYINIEDIALRTGKSKRTVLKEIKKFMKKGFYPEGHLDRQETCFMLDDKIFEEYLQLERQRHAMADPVAPAQTERSQVQQVETPQASSELEKMVSEGQTYINQLREMNDNIAGEEISSKLFRLEGLLKEIFVRLQEHPEKLPMMKKFMNYYLPTTIKLVGAYQDFDSMPEQGSDVLEAKNEIEKTLDTINNAFVEVINKIMRETAYDVTTDAQVLQAMLAKEGLTGQDFESANNAD